MTRWLLGFMVGIVLCAAMPARAAIDREGALPPAVPRLALGHPVLAPFAHVRFCLAHAEECRRGRQSIRRARLHLTAERLAELESVNRAVNAAIRPEAATGGVAAEEWRLGPARGDCNDYAVTKRRALAARGWPPSAILLALVRLPDGQHHLVLVARTDRGDLVLDNLRAAIVPWTRPGYTWLKVQSPRNPTLWLAARAA